MSHVLGWGEYSFDWDRFERALHLNVSEDDENGAPLPKDHYRVGSRYVSLEDKSCDCPDFTWGDHRLCKHFIAVLLETYDPLMLMHLRKWKMDHKSIGGL